MQAAKCWQKFEPYYGYPLARRDEVTIHRLTFGSEQERYLFYQKHKVGFTNTDIYRFF